MFCTMASFTARTCPLLQAPLYLAILSIATIKGWLCPLQQQLSTILCSLGLGFAVTVETQVNDGGRNTLGGHRGALYMGTVLAALGLVVSICFVCTSWGQHRRDQKR
ncbi:uncharacterized protein N7529_003514 [Penicillium soppii]|uniref:uncharacterized protein n=1 Tax=Penicillium soppii TaxID=69789 RepID=UPI002546CF5F|nr:uncharacterized protein N7529_003514 [Penicillium soppii]KAJ5871161.1 hypothetical protein N7529_003514 [Penicillium soppii]